MSIIIEGQVSGLNSLKDGTVKLSIALQEMRPEDVGVLFSLNNQHVKVYLSTENIFQEAIDQVDALEIEVNEKSPSKRLKNVFYRLWEQDKEGYEDSELYYRRKMEQVIEFYKNKLT